MNLRSVHLFSILPVQIYSLVLIDHQILSNLTPGLWLELATFGDFPSKSTIFGWRFIRTKKFVANFPSTEKLVVNLPSSLVLAGDLLQLRP